MVRALGGGVLPVIVISDTMAEVMREMVRES